jgi:hypothetical protein
MHKDAMRKKEAMALYVLYEKIAKKTSIKIYKSKKTCVHAKPKERMCDDDDDKPLANSRRPTKSRDEIRDACPFNSILQGAEEHLPCIATTKRAAAKGACR